MKKRYLLSAALLVACVLVSSSVEAQDEITTLTNNLTTTHTTMKGTYVTIRNVIFVVCGLIGLVILPGKYQKMQSGDPDAGKSMLNWAGALIFVSVAAYILQMIFFK